MPIDKETGWTEPDIIINGHTLSFAECMTIRVALSQFQMFMSNMTNAINVGERLAEGYNYHVTNIIEKMRKT
jgi:hypothetical protein